MTYTTTRFITLPDRALWTQVEAAVREVGGSVGEAGVASDDLVEQLADAEHASWARWMAYLFSKCEAELEEGAQKRAVPTGALVIPAGLVRHWQRQIDTPYADLSEREKESDRNEVRLILPLIEAATRNASEPPCPRCSSPLEPVFGASGGMVCTREGCR